MTPRVAACTSERSWWVSCRQYTVRVDSSAKGGRQVITFAAPIVRKFVGQPLESLYAWITKKFGELRVVELEPAARRVAEQQDGEGR